MKFTRKVGYGKVNKTMSKIIVLLFLFTKCFAFDLPPGCKNDLTIDKHQYNVTTRYDTGDAVPTDAHYDSKGNLFFVLFGCNYDGFYFDIKVIKPNSSTPESIPGKLVDLRVSLNLDCNLTRC